MRQKIHIIKRQLYEIKTMKQHTAMDIQNRIGEINTNYVLPMLAEKMDKYFYSDEVVIIDKLEIDIGKIKTDAAENVWVGMIFESLDNRLKSITENKNDKKQKEKHLVESWMSFLKNGMLPADCIYKNVDEIKKELHSLDENAKDLLRSFLFYEVNDDMIIRLIGNTDSETKKIHLQLLLPGINIDWLNAGIDEAVMEIVQETPTSTTEKNFYNLFLWHHIISHFILNKNKAISSGEIIQYVINKAIELKEISKPDFQDNKLKEGELFKKQIDDPENLGDGINERSLNEEGVFFSNAGICLLTPWLPTFFKGIGLAVENNFMDKWKQQHAVYLLHYIVTNEEEPTEELLIFPKLLCGWPLQMPVINSFQITEYERTECENLLRSVIENWKALKNTSIKGLQESFLQRSGKLIEQNDQFVVQPEQQSIDLLLEFVPWTFRLIRLPWMKKAMQIDWY